MSDCIKDMHTHHLVCPDNCCLSLNIVHRVGYLSEETVSSENMWVNFPVDYINLCSSNALTVIDLVSICFNYRSQRVVNISGDNISTEKALCHHGRCS